MASRRKQKQFEQFLQTLPQRPGVYRMLDRDGAVLYVGKSRNLKARVTSYFRASGLASKTMRLIGKTHEIQTTVTNSETEALLLEQNFIKVDQPPFNVILKDDKSYPFIHLSNHEYPRIKLHRGARRGGGSFYGPYPSAGAVRQSISILQNVFKLRPCTDTFFKNRSRPCLQYQINRCRAPCVGFLTPSEYEDDIRLAELFLSGKSQAVLDEFKSKMEQAASELNFEDAARYRDQIDHLRKVQETQYVHADSGDVDAFGIAIEAKYVCVQGLFIRDGRLLGHRSWYPKNELESEATIFLAAFVAQYYFGSVARDLPRSVVTSIELENADVLASALSELAQRKVEVTSHVRSKRARWLKMVQENAHLALSAHIQEKANVFDRFVELQTVFGFSKIPKRLECFDISHSSGEATVASCVVFDTTGPLKSDYRRFNIGSVQSGDDYGALAQAVERRFRRRVEEEAPMPDILVIDGGRGQINRVAQVLEELKIREVVLVGISKDSSRRAELDTVWRFGQGRVEIDPHSGAMHLLQSIRDEAHRFAVAGHRGRRKKSRQQSELDTIAGIGPKRRKDLLTHFGSINTIKAASAEAIAEVPGINRKLADEIYGVFHAA